jgi:hypothetical protein
MPNGLMKPAVLLRCKNRKVRDDGRTPRRTDNPFSITLYSAMRADSFDGLEWCQTVVDHETGLLYHLSHVDFVVKHYGTPNI